MTSGRNPDFLKACSAKSTAGLNGGSSYQRPFAPKFTYVDRTNSDFHIIVSRRPVVHYVDIDHRIHAAFVEIAKLWDQTVTTGSAIGQINQWYFTTDKLGLNSQNMLLYE